MTAHWGYFAGGTIHVICSSHNDIAWFDSPASTIEWRDQRSITPALDRMIANPAVHFSMENVLYLLEYLDRHPERRAAIHELARQKRFDWGATYNQPYESLLSGEQLVRQVYFGKRLIERVLPGAEARVYYSPDVPGRAMQMPQILARAGVRYMLISRHRPGVQRWCSPDGSSVLFWSMGHYVDVHSTHHQLEGPLDDVTAKVQSELGGWADEYRRRGMPPDYAFLYSADYIPPKDYDDLIAQWNAQDGDRPALRYSTPDQFFDAVAAASPDLETITGERPNVWLYIHGPTHHHAVTAKREAGILLPAAEIFHAVLALLSGSWAGYPAAALADAWVKAIYDDHGWGGRNGHITDRTFQQKLEAARDQSRGLLDRALNAIARRIQPAQAGVPVVVFNALSWSRTDPVRVALPASRDGYSLVDGSGRPVPLQLARVNTGQATEAVFVAPDVPSIGHKTFYCRPTPGPAALPASVRYDENSYENAFFRVELAPGGIRSLFDKRHQREVLRTDRFLGMEIFMLESTGNGAGEFGSVQQPSAAGEFERASGCRPGWTVGSAGPVFVEYILNQPLRHCLLLQTLTFYHALDRIDCAVSLLDWNGTRSREFRLALPLNLAAGAQIAYEVPMGIVEVGRSEIAGRAADGPVYGFYTAAGYIPGPAYTDICAEIRPRETQNFISASDMSLGVTLSTSVAACDWIDPTLQPVPYPVLQPILLASRKSCHSEGNWYVQPGDHHYHFSLCVHEPGWRHGWRPGIAANHALAALVPEPADDADLPPDRSYFGLAADNVMITTLKKAEDDDALILRCVELAGLDTAGRLSSVFPVRSAQQTDIIERNGTALAVEGGQLTLTLGHHAIETFRLELQGGRSRA